MPNTLGQEKVGCFKMYKSPFFSLNIDYFFLKKYFGVEKINFDTTLRKVSENRTA
jgi:hypothetical protein